MPTLTITRGLPASGKTTWARQQPGWRINRDNLRAMMLCSWDHGSREHEDACTLAQHSAVEALLRSGRDVIVDDTNLDPSHVDALRQIAHRCNAQFRIHDLTGVSLDVCIARDAERERPVGAHVIRAMWQRHLAPAVHEDADPGMPAEVN